MTIKRQYSLPNCRLVLEGLSDEVDLTGENARPRMSILVNAECHFAGSEQHLTGGRDFLEGLVKGVSAYAQEFLSGIAHPIDPNSAPEMVTVARGHDPNLHYLRYHHTSEGQQAETLELPLNTVQLFDLVEAIDQFLLDNRTLPDLALRLQPVSRRYRKADVPVTERAKPMAVGLGSLAIAAALLFAVPIPEVERPDPRLAEDRQEQTEETDPRANLRPVAEMEVEEVVAFLAGAPLVEDPTEIRYLQRYLFRELNNAWQERGGLGQTLTYRVSLTRDGSIVGYQGIQGTPQEAAEQTPLADLAFIPIGREGLEEGLEEAIAPFRVVFTNRSVLQVTPWDGEARNATLGPEIEDRPTLRRLRDELRETLSAAWAEGDTEGRSLIFRVAVTEEGAIADYEAQNQPAFDLEQITPLPELVNPAAAGMGKEQGTWVPQEPLGQFRVVFRDGGVLEVSALRGL
ncbi:DUF4335 domain-containing protein [Spirulina subsalsa FACHB-351]|uniref:DUF4335 domain-containing protein n=1 Tax=Spirulina subsalsa FACHB-351 TaxID=234711 RepID=A0ABT3LCW8_9CYAN|nr:DUF4335 domain-containing protein [Spirulina subsalsa]MCW6038949.1 DUF4335 domain-containing protein [Spirulina subsalsa FACHB-351]